MRSPAPITGAPGVQEVGTPPAFIQAVESHFQTRIIHDLAANDDQHVCESYFTRYDAPLHPETKWPSTKSNESLWLNPPFSDIPRWLEAVWDRHRSGLLNVLVLVPASVDTEWYSTFVEGRCGIRWIRPRITFVGHTQSYPKALMLLDYSWRPNTVRQWIWKPVRSSK